MIYNNFLGNYFFKPGFRINFNLEIKFIIDQFKFICYNFYKLVK